MPRPSAPAKSPTLSESAYRRLARDVKALLNAADTTAATDRLAAYWRIGDRLSREKIAQQAGYHNSILRDLADDSGLALRTLQEAFTFRALYPSLPKKGALTWSHYRLLLRLDSADERRFYEQLCRDKNFGARDLNQALASGVFQGGPIEQPRLTRPRDPSYLYAARALALVDADTFDLDVDLGFHCWTKQRVRLARIDCSEFGSPKARAARNFVAQELLPAKTLVIQSLKTDIHGRFVVHFFYSSSPLGILDCFTRGLYLNDLLVRKGHAELVS